MLLPHVVHLHVGKRLAYLKALFKHKSRMIGVYVDLDHFIIAHAHNGISYTLKISLKAGDPVCIKRLLKINYKLGAVSEFYIVRGYPVPRPAFRVLTARLIRSLIN